MLHVEEVEDSHYRAATLKGRGWSESMIRQLLGEADARTQNPLTGRSKAGIRWYLRSRVEAAEHSAQFIALCRKAKNRSATATEVAMRRTAALLEEVEKIPITVPQRKLDHVRKEALEAYMRRKWEKDYWDGGGRIRSRATFADRITVNYIRHELTDYDGLLAALRGKSARMMRSIWLGTAFSI